MPLFFSLSEDGTPHTLFVVLVLIWFLRMLGSRKSTPPTLPPPTTDPVPPPVVSDPPVVIPPSQPPPPKYTPKLSPYQQNEAWVFFDTAFPGVARAARETIEEYRDDQAMGVASLPGTYKQDFENRAYEYEQMLWGPQYLSNLKHQGALGGWIQTRIYNGKKAVQDLLGLFV